VVLAGLGAGATMLGLLLFYQGLRSLLARPSGALRFPRAGWTILLGGGLFLLMILCGIVALVPGGIVSAYVFPPFHVVAQAMPPLIVLALAGWAAFPRRSDVGQADTRSVPYRPTWRQLVTQLTYGSLGAVSMSMLLEVVLLVLVVLVVVVLVVLIPGRLATWQDLLGVIRSNPNWQDDSDLARRVLTMPETLVLLLCTTLIIAPLVEEAVKALGVALMSHRVRSASTALIFGLACGAGFAVAESWLNGAGATDPAQWGEVAVLRFGASLMHCLTGALMGLGWYYAIWQRKPWRLLGTYLLCLGIHILWNIVATALGVVPVQLGGEGPLSPASIASYFMGGLLLVYTAAMLAGLLWLARRTRSTMPVPAVVSAE
jgi:RsiW-degrading membrane proteinase PrsW (M82 family)